MKRWIGVVALCAAVFMMVGASPRPCCGDTTLIGFTDTDLSIGFELGFGNSLGNYSAVYASWTQTVATSNTSIGAILSSVGGLGGTAWLTTEVGPGTSDHVIATGSFTTPELTASQLRDLNTAPTTPLFAGLSLNPGTYYLILQSNVLPEGTFIAWCGEYLVNVVDTTAPGFTIGPWEETYPVSAFPPASTFTPVVQEVALFYSVDGTPVPVPSTLPLLGSGLLGIVGWRRFRKA